MTFPDERDQELAELLRTTLRGEADAIAPAGDGLARIRERVDARRMRRLWLRPLAAVGALAVVGVAGAAAYALTRPAHHADSLITTQPTTSEAPITPTPTPTVTSASLPAFPTSGMFPFTTAADEHASALPWAGDPTQVAIHFVSDFAGVSGVDQVVTSSTSGGLSKVQLGRYAPGHRMVPVTTVVLTRYDQSWIVVDAGDARGMLQITTPVGGTRVSSPLVVRGPDYGVDEAVQLSLRSLHATSPLAHDTVSFGSSGGEWTSKLRFTAPADPVGAVVAYETSAEDGGPARLVATPVRFTGSTVQAGGYPRYFYGVKGDRITKYAARNGAAISYLTPAQPAASDPQLVGDRVYYLASFGTCVNTLMSVPAAGGATQTVAAPEGGYQVTSYAVSADGKNVALFESACQPDSSKPQGLLVSSVRGTATSHTIEFPSFPPMIVGNPSWEPDGTHIDAVERTGNMASPMRWDAFAAKDVNDANSVCGSPLSGLPTDLRVDANGVAWVALQTGDAMTVVRCAAQKVWTAFSVAGQDTPTALAVTSDGQAALLADMNGAVWRWTAGSTAATKLSPAPPQQQVTW